MNFEKQLGSANIKIEARSNRVIVLHINTTDDGADMEPAMKQLDERKCTNCVPDSFALQMEAETRGAIRAKRD